MADVNWADFTPAPNQDISNLVGAITRVESGGDAGAVSSQGATGSMQIMPATFRQYAGPGEDYASDADRRAAATRKIIDDYLHYGGDTAKTAAAYIGGRGAVLPDGTIRDDVADANGTTPAAYAQMVLGRISARPQVDWSQFAPVADAGGGRGFVNPPAADPNTALPQPAGSTYTPADLPLDPETSGPADLAQALQASPDAGAGRGFVNPPAVGDFTRDVGVLESMGRAAGRAGAFTAEIPSLLVAAGGAAFDKLHSFVSGSTQTGAQDWIFRNLVDPRQQAVDWYALAPNEKQDFLAKVGDSIGSTLMDLPLMIASGGINESQQLAEQAPTLARFLTDVTSRGFDAMRAVMVKAGTEKAKQVLDSGGTTAQAMNSGTVAALWTGLTGAQPMSASGNILRRVATGVPVGMVQEEAGRAVQNAADPANLQAPFDPAQMLASGASNAVMAAALGHAAPARAQPDHVADLFNAGSVEEAAQAAARIAEPDARAPQADVASELRAIRPAQPVELQGAADERAAADLSAVPAGADRAGGADAGAGLGAGVGPDRVGRDAVDTGSVPRETTAGAAPVGAAGEVPEAVEEPLFRRGTGDTISADPVADIEDRVSTLTRDWLRKPDIHVLQSMDEAPEPVRRIWEQQNSQGTYGHVEGFHWRGGVYLLADALHTPDDVQRVLYHEALGHFGLRGVFGDSLNGILDEVAGSMKPALEAKADQYGFDLTNQRQRQMAAEEVLAEIAQTRPELGVVQRAVAAIRTFLRAHGVDSLAMTRDEIIRNYILPARGYVERGESQAPSFAQGNRVAFSRGENDEFPPVEQFDRINVGPGGFIKPRAVAPGEHTYRETSVSGLDDRMREDRYAVPFNGFVADRQELALGQGENRGVQLTFRPGSVSGREHAKPMTGELAGREYRTDLLAPRAVHAVTMWPTDLKQARFLTRQRLAAEFDRKDLSDGRVHFTRKGLPAVQPPRLDEVPFTRNASGTLTITGNEDTARRALASAGITRLVNGKSGILIGNADAERAARVLEAVGQQPMFSRKGTTAATSGMPITAPTSRWERAKSIVSDLIDEGLSRSGIYRLTAPMSEGSVRARAIAQNFANSERLARAQWQRISDLLQKRFTPDERRTMWEAADEQNTLLQQGLPTAGRGLDRLSAAQRDVVEQLHTYGEELLRRAKNAGMFEGEGLPYWTPRMMVMIDANGEYARPTEPGKKATSDGEGRNVFTSSSNLKQRKYLTAAETEAAMQAKGGELVRDIMTMPLAMDRLERAIAGRELVNQIKDLGRARGTPTVQTGRPDHEGWFTLDHNAFTTFRPRFERDEATGKMQPVLDSHGDIVFDRVPLYMSKEFEGPVRAILSHTDGPLYRAFMLLKSKAMSAIMFSPLIHNLVIFGRALGYDPTVAGTVGLYVSGHAARQDNELFRTAISGGMVPMGYGRNGMLDITDVARGFGREGGWLDPRESWIAHGAKAIVGAVNKDAGAAAKRFVDRAGDFWHGTLLWNRVADLQMGIFAHAYQRLQDKGFSPDVAKVMAAHWANRYAGAIARENMSDYARKAANVLLFSRSFNMGNLGTIKDLAYGMPSGLRAKIEQEAGQANAAKAFTEARRKAWSGFVADTALSIIALSLAQSAVDRLKKDKGWDEIFGGYVDRAQRMWANIKAHPANPTAYSPWQISPTYDNEPGKQDRVDMGEIPDQGGRHEYMRLPTGKVVEDLINWTTHFPTTFESKTSPLAKAAWQVLTNDRGFGVPVYDPNGSVAQGALDVAKYLAKAQTPWDTIVTAWDKLHGKSTAIENDKLVGNATGFSFSQGHPQGPEAGVAADVEQRIQAQKMLAMEDVKRMLRYGDEDAARAKLEGIGLSPREVTTIIRRIEEPAPGMTRGQMKKFNQHSNEQDQERMGNVTR